MPETSVILILRGTGIFLALFYIYPTVPYAPASLHSFLLPVTVVKSIGPKRHTYFYSLVLELILSYSTSYPIVPHAGAFLHSFLLQVTVVKTFLLPHAPAILQNPC